MRHPKASDRYSAAVCRAVRNIGARVGWPVPTLALAQLLVHVALDAQAFPLQPPAPLDAACAFLYVAGKMTDTQKRLRDLLLVVHRFNSDDGVDHEMTGSCSNDPSSERLERWQVRVIALERSILESIRFQFNIPLPFDFLVQMCKTTLCPRHIALAAFEMLYEAYSCNIVARAPLAVLALAVLRLAVELAATPSMDLPRALLEVLGESCASQTIVTHALLDHFIGVTPNSDPAFEKYRSIKIRLNQQQPLLMLQAA